MIGYIKGKILNLTPETALIETAAGIGFELLISNSAFSLLSNAKEGALFTYLQSREDGVTLFGFASPEEKEMFIKLISVSGVGAKMGITVLAAMNVAELAAAIATGDVKRLTSVKGLGKKTAEHLILDLREKVSLNSSIAEQSPAAAEVISSRKADEDAIVALMTLGFSRSESEKAVSRAKQNGAKEIEDIIRLALQGI